MATKRHMRKAIRKGKAARRGRASGYRRQPKGYRKMGGFKGKVRKAIDAMLPLQSKQYGSASYCPNYATGTLLQLQLTPNAGYLSIAQGNGEGDRVGNQVRVKKATLRGVMLPLAYHVTNNNPPAPWEVRFVIGRNKQNALIAPPIPSFFQAGDTAVSPVGDITDIINYINKDTQTVYRDFSFKIGPAGVTGTGATAGQQYYANNDFKLNKKINIDITKYVPKTITYNDTTTTPISHTTWLTVLPATPDGNAGTAYSQALEFEWFIEYEYTI